jgi:hypothetical protein
MKKAALLFSLLFSSSVMLAVRKKSRPWKRDLKTGTFLNLHRRRKQLLRVDVYSPLQSWCQANKGLFPCNKKTPFGRNVDRMNRGIQQIQTVLEQMNNGKNHLHRNVYYQRDFFFKVELQQAWADLWELYRIGLEHGYDAGGHSFMKYYQDQVEFVPEWIEEMNKIKHEIDHVIVKDEDLGL